MIRLARAFSAFREPIRVVRCFYTKSRPVFLIYARDGKYARAPPTIRRARSSGSGAVPSPDRFVSEITETVATKRFAQDRTKSTVRYASPAKTVVGFDVRRNARDARYGSWRVKDAPLGGRLTICRRHGDSLWRLCDPVRRKFAVGTTTTVRDVKANGSISTISIRKRLLCLGGEGDYRRLVYVRNERAR